MRLTSLMARPLTVLARLACMLLLTQAPASATKCPEEVNTAIWYLLPSDDAVAVGMFPRFLSGGLHGEDAATLIVVRDAERDGDFVLELERIR